MGTNGVTAIIWEPNDVNIVGENNDVTVIIWETNNVNVVLLGTNNVTVRL